MLSQLIGTPIAVERFLRLAIGIAAAVVKMHQHGLVHKDIKPANVLVDRTDGAVRLTGFGIASRLPRERQPPGPPEMIAGTLAYMAPEQTGRMNRSIDSRSDLYSLGVTFYEMLTGALPFIADGPHRVDPLPHRTASPKPPSERVQEVPRCVSAIVMKLLAKAAEERYQTAAGLQRDLERCLAEWDDRQRIEPFTLGERDMPDRLLIPEKLYGRAHEIETLLAAFERVAANGAPELVLVSGYSGIGKSAVVTSCTRCSDRQRGLFASGKFDQYKRDVPYATLAQAFQGLIRADSGEDRERASRLARQACPGTGAERLADGRISSQSRSSSSENSRRYRSFLRWRRKPASSWSSGASSACSPGGASACPVPRRPAVARRRNARPGRGPPDAAGRASPAPGRRLPRQRSRLAATPWCASSTRIRQAGAKTRHIVLAPLARDDLTELLTDSLHCDAERARPLAQLILAKTGGNPFFTIQFISTLVEESLLTFDHTCARWCWDLGLIDAKGYTDNVADLMAGTLNRLPMETQEVLQLLACVGNSRRHRSPVPVA